MGRRKPSAAQLPLTEGAPKKRPAAPIVRLVAATTELVATFEREAPKRVSDTDRQRARRARFVEIADGHGPMQKEWRVPRTRLERFALLQWYEGPTPCAWLSTHESPAAASEISHGEQAETGYEPIALFDLDSHDEYRPVVSVTWELEIDQ